MPEKPAENAGEHKHSMRMWMRMKMMMTGRRKTPSIFLHREPHDAKLIRN